MKYKIVLIISLISLLFLIFSFTSMAASQETLTVTEIQQLIQKNEFDKALELLNEHDISHEVDLQFYQALLWSWQGDYVQAEDKLKTLIENNPQREDFYEQLVRIYGWQGKYARADKLLKESPVIKNNPRIMALLAQQAEWQEQWFKAKRLRKKALQLARGSDLEEEYQKKLEQAEKMIKPQPFLDLNLLYEEELEFDILPGITYPLREGIIIEGSGGPVFNQKGDFKVKLETEFWDLLLTPGLTAEFIIDYIFSDDSKDFQKYNYIGDLEYEINNKHKFGVNLDIQKEKGNNERQFEILTGRYSYKYENITAVLKASARHYNSGWITDFSRHLTIYYPVDRYLMHFNLSYYQGGDYSWRIGMELSDLSLTSGRELEFFQGWINNEKTSNFRFRFK